MNSKITFVELVDLIAEATSTSKRMCELFLREFFNTVSQALVDGENVKIKGIGTFKVTQVKSRKAPNAQSDDSSEEGTHNKLTFTPDKSLAEALNQPFAQFETVFLDDAVTDEKLDEIDRLYPSYFPDTRELPEPPDYPLPPVPDGDEIPAITQATATQQQKKAAVVEPKPEPKPEPRTEPKLEPKPEPKAKAKTEAKPKSEPVKPLMGRPIDGPSTPPAKAIPIPGPTPKEEEVEQKGYFYRPEPRNAYTPTEEQLAERQHGLEKYKRWLWIALGVLAAALLLWGITRCNGKADTDKPVTAVVADSDSVATVEEAAPKVTTEPEKPAKPVEAEKPVEKPKKQAEPDKTEKQAEPDKTEKPVTATAKPAKSAVVTDTVTAQIVLVTLAEKHYGSPWFWVYIYEENKSKIANPNNIKPGTVVVIPPASKYGIDPNSPASLKKARRRSWELLK